MSGEAKAAEITEDPIETQIRDAQLTAPDRIYLQLGDDANNLNEVTWAKDRVSDTDVEYRRAQPDDAFKSFFGQLMGRRVVIQEKARIILIGLLAGKKDEFFCLADVEIHGRGKPRKIPRLWVDRGCIAHIHEEVETQQANAAELSE